MYCNYCGTKNSDSAVYCKNCGKMVVMEQPAGRMHVQLKCKNCNSTMSISDYKNGLVLTCPYCQSTELILESEYLTSERIKTDAYKEVELAKQQAKREIAFAKNEISQTKADAEKSRGEAERLRSEAEKIRSEAEKMRIKNEKKHPFRESVIITVLGLILAMLALCMTSIHPESKALDAFLTNVELTLFLVGVVLILIGFVRRRVLNHRKHKE